MSRILACVTLVFAILPHLWAAQSPPRDDGGPGGGRERASADGRAEAREEWSELNAARSGLDPSRITAAVLGRSESPAYTSELVRLEWRRDDPIDLYVVRPRGAARPPVIVYLYSYPADTERFQNRAWCEQVTKNGFAAAGFVSALTGQRYHGRPMREWFVSELRESLGTTTHDVGMILAYLAGRGDLDAGKVGMLGEGSGAAVAILAASADPGIAFVDAINPWGDWPDWLRESPLIPGGERARYLTPEFLAGVSSLDPLAYLPHLAPARIRVEQVAQDAITPRAAQARLRDATPGSSLVEYRDRGAQVEAWLKQSWWLKDRLRGAGTPRSGLTRPADAGGRPAAAGER